MKGLVNVFYATTIRQIIICLLFYCLPIYAHSQTIYLRNFTVIDGLGQNYVSCVYGDKRGFLWLVNEKLIFFDGVKFRECPSSVKFASTVFRMTEDTSGNLILLSSDKLYIRYNGRLQELILPGYFHPGFMSCLVDRKNQLWIGSTNGKIYRCLLSGNKVTQPKIIEGDYNKYILSIYEDSFFDRIIVGGFDKIFSIENEKMLELFTKAPEASSSGNYRNISSDVNGTIYFTDNFENAINRQGKLIYSNALGSATSKVTLYQKIKSGILYSIGDTIYYKNNRGTKFNINSLFSGKIGSVARQVCIDNIGNFWVGHSGGLLKISLYPIKENFWSKDGYPKGSKILYKESLSAKHYFLLNEYLDLYEVNGDRHRRHPLKFELQKIWKTEFINYITWELKYTNFKYLRNGTLLIYLNKCLIAYDTKKNKVIKSTPLITVGRCNPVYSIGDSVCWVKDDEKMIYTDGKKEKFVFLGNQFKFRPLFDVKATKYGKTWFATEHGFYLYSADSLTLVSVAKTVPDNTNYTSLIELSDSAILICAGASGIFKLTDHATGYAIEKFIEESSIQDYGNSNTFLDNARNLWIANNQNICVIKNIDSSNRLVYPYFNDYYLDNPMFQQSSLNDIYNAGYNRFENSIWYDGAFPWMIQLDSLGNSINANNINPYFFRIEIKNFLHDDSISEKLLSGTAIRWQLKYSQNDIRVEFGAKNFSSIKGLRYSYYLEGYDKVWEHSSAIGQAEYTNLPPGNYTFHLRIPTVDTAEISFSFSIHPPWYKTWWATTIWVLVAGFIIYLLFRWRLNVIRKKAAMEKLVVDNELKALRAQINPHFIQNTFDLMADGIYTGDKEYSYNIIKKVSAYLRQVLYKTELSTVTLEEELEYTEDYLNMQKMIHAGLFDFAINVRDDVDTFGVEVPSLLIQPIVENSIKHGFAEITNGGLIEIIVVQADNEVTITVLDNGKGLDENDNLIKRNSKGLEITKRRLSVMNGERNSERLTVLMKNRIDGVKGTEFTIKFQAIEIKKKKKNDKN